MAAPKLFLDENVDVVVGRILASHGLDVLAARDAGRLGGKDDEQLRFAAAHDRCLVSHNIGDFVRLQTRCVNEGIEHAGILLLPAAPKPSVIASKILRRLARETAETAKSALLFA